ncbi:hypothetical protein Dsin_027852 [Dipteronia sinensis]|uniref:Uncharacterized protein n=1 Tax=Dipteronia sinensis TaxID=43782 RepID=A0AAE0DTZ4_9ROSI|nr:hypothetical protein Dsin_027852 [Dipteronia sinensis]
MTLANSSFKFQEAFLTSGTMISFPKSIFDVLVDKSARGKEVVKVSGGAQPDVNPGGSAHQQQLTKAQITANEISLGKNDFRKEIIVPKVRKASWNLKEELAKVIKARVDFGCDFKGRKKDMVEEIVRRIKVGSFMLITQTTNTSATTFKLDSYFYREVPTNEEAVMQLDQELAFTGPTREIDADYVNKRNIFRKKFAKTMIKLGNVNWLVF